MFPQQSFCIEPDTYLKVNGDDSQSDQKIDWNANKRFIIALEDKQCLRLGAIARYFFKYPLIDRKH